MEEIALENCSMKLRNTSLRTVYLFVIYGFSWVGVHGEEAKSCLLAFSLWLPNKEVSHRQLGPRPQPSVINAAALFCYLIVSFVEVASSQ